MVDKMDVSEQDNEKKITEGVKESRKRKEAEDKPPVKTRKPRTKKEPPAEHKPESANWPQMPAGIPISEDEMPEALKEIVARIKDALSSDSNFNINAVAYSFPADKAKQPEQNAKKEENEAQKKREDKLKKIREFHYIPREIRDYLNRFVVAQEGAKRVLSVAICDHYNYIKRCLENPKLDEVDHAKHNVILLGPSGVGKTYIMRCLAKLLGVPFVKADATKYSETGYVGYDVEDIIRDLIKAADGDVALAQYGIVYIDEIDKLGGRGIDGFSGHDISGRGVQVNLLKIMEDSEVKVHSQMDMFGMMRSAMSGERQPSTIRTKNILFIVSGAFDKLSDIIRKRLGKSQIGFGREQANQDNRSDAEILSQVQTQDLIDYGFEPEFIGRLPVRVALSDLGVKDLEKILNSVENGFLSQYVDAFAGYGIKLNVKADAIPEIARLAADEKTGARGLLTILERTFRNLKFELPGSGISELIVDSDTIRDPDKALAKILEKPKGLSREEIAEVFAKFQDEYKAKFGREYPLKDETLSMLYSICDASPELATPAGCNDILYKMHLICSNIGDELLNDRKALEEEIAKDPAKFFARISQGMLPPLDEELLKLLKK